MLFIDAPAKKESMQCIKQVGLLNVWFGLLCVSDDDRRIKNEVESFIRWFYARCSPHHQNFWFFISKLKTLKIIASIFNYVTQIYELHFLAKFVFRNVVTTISLSIRFRFQVGGFSIKKVKGLVKITSIIGRCFCSYTRDLEFRDNIFDRMAENLIFMAVAVFYDHQASASTPQVLTNPMHSHAEKTSLVSCPISCC